MNRLLALLGCLCLAPSISICQDATRIVEEEVRKVQDDMIAAYLHKDVAVLDHIFADDYTFTRDDGTLMTKRRTLDGFRPGGGREVLSYKLMDEKVRVKGDLAVITYRCRVSEIFEGREDSGDFSVTRILVRHEDLWQMVGGQETRISNMLMATKGRLVGSWRLVSAGTFRKDGAFEPYPEYGPNARGYLMYDSTGHMCVSLANPNHPRWTNAEKPTDVEKVRSYDVFFAYCGTYEVREKEGRVIHRPEMGSWPHYIGTDQSRNFRLEGDRLILSDEETPPSGEHRRYQITWERVAKELQ